MVSLDRAINNDFLTISKSLIPYLPLENQKSLAIFVKTFELMQTINLFSKEDVVHSMSRSHEAGWEKEFLKDVRQNLSGDRGYFIDALLKLTEVKDLIDHHPTANNYVSPAPIVDPYPDDTTVNSPPNNGPSINPADVIDKLSTMLQPNQIQLLKVLSSFMK